MKMKVLPSYLILLSFYIIQATKLPNKVSSSSAVQQTSTSSSSVSPLIPNSTPTKRARPRSTQKNVTNKTQTTSPRATSTSTRSTSSRKSVPKKYIPTTEKPSTVGPLKISLSKTVGLPASSNKNSKSKEKLDDLICPKEGEANFELFAPPCQSDRDCTAWNRNERCCKLFGSRNCIKGVPKPLEEEKHIPLLGLIPRKCPNRPLAELWWELKTCETDDDCWPRVCCPDGRRRYCRAPAPEYEAVPHPIGRSIAYLSEYLECTPPPPPVFDLHPKSCNSTLDCFPNICCQETGRKFCRPPKKSVLTVMANFLNLGLVKRLTKNLVIK